MTHKVVMYIVPNAISNNVISNSVISKNIISDSFLLIYLPPNVMLNDSWEGNISHVIISIKPLSNLLVNPSYVNSLPY